MPVLATSRNLTILGVLAIVGAIVPLLKAIFDGDVATAPDWGAAAKEIVYGVGLVLAKGAASTGGVVDPAGKPVVTG